MNTSPHHVQAPALLQDEHWVDVRADELRERLAGHVNAVFGSAAREEEPGVWRVERMSRSVQIRLEDHGSRSRVAVATRIRPSIFPRILAVLLGMGTIAAWVVAAAATFSDFRGAQTDARLFLWVAALAAAFVLTPLTLHLAKRRRVNASSDLGKMAELGLLIGQTSPRQRIARGYRLDPMAVDEAYEEDASAFERPNEMRATE